MTHCQGLAFEPISIVIRSKIIIVTWYCEWPRFRGCAPRWSILHGFIIKKYILKKLGNQWNFQNSLLFAVHISIDCRAFTEIILRNGCLFLSRSLWILYIQSRRKIKKNYEQDIKETTTACLEQVIPLKPLQPIR